MVLQLFVLSEDDEGLEEAGQRAEEAQESEIVEDIACLFDRMLLKDV